MQTIEALPLPVRDHCTVIWVLHPVGGALYNCNYMVVRHELWHYYGKWDCAGISVSNPVFVESVTFEPVEIDLVNEKTDIVIGDRYERLAFERVMRNRKEMFYANMIDYLININETKCSNNYFCNYAYSISFLKYFWNYNSYFQRILIAVNKIIHDINYNHDHVQYIYLDMHIDLELY